MGDPCDAADELYDLSTNLDLDVRTISPSKKSDAAEPANSWSSEILEKIENSTDEENEDDTEESEANELPSIDVEQAWDPANLDLTDHQKYALTKAQHRDVTEGNRTKQIDETIDLLPYRIAHLIEDIKLLSQNEYLDKEDWEKLSWNSKAGEALPTGGERELGRELGLALRAAQQSADQAGQWDQFIWGIVRSYIEDKDSDAETENFMHLIDSLQHEFNQRRNELVRFERAPKPIDPSDKLEDLLDSILGELTDEAAESLERRFGGTTVTEVDEIKEPGIAIPKGDEHKEPGTAEMERDELRELIDSVKNSIIRDVCKLQRDLEADFDTIDKDREKQFLCIMNILLYECRATDGTGFFEPERKSTLVDEVTERLDPESDVEADIVGTGIEGETALAIQADDSIRILAKEHMPNSFRHPIITKTDESDNKYCITAYGALLRSVYDYKANDQHQCIGNFYRFYSPWRDDRIEPTEVNRSHLDSPIAAALLEVIE